MNCTSPWPDFTPSLLTVFLTVLIIIPTMCVCGKYPEGMRQSEMAANGSKAVRQRIEQFSQEIVTTVVVDNLRRTYGRYPLYSLRSSQLKPSSCDRRTRNRRISYIMMFRTSCRRKNIRCQYPVARHVRTPRCRAVLQGASAAGINQVVL